MGIILAEGGAKSLEFPDLVGNNQQTLKYDNVWLEVLLPLRTPCLTTSKSVTAFNDGDRFSNTAFSKPVDVFHFDFLRMSAKRRKISRKDLALTDDSSFRTPSSTEEGQTGRAQNNTIGNVSYDVLGEITTGNPFFENTAVKAWYSGASQEGLVMRVQLSQRDMFDNASAVLAPPATSDEASSKEREQESNSTDDDLYGMTELDAMDSTNGFVIPSDERLAEIKQKASVDMQLGSDDMRPCCICELDYLQSEIHKVEFTKERVERMKACISSSEDVPAVILGQYNAGSVDSRLTGLLLFPEAIYRENEATWGYICNSCEDSINGSKFPQKPVDSIANGNYIGHLPRRFQVMTRTDEQAVALVLPCVSLSVVTGGPCHTIKSHHYIVRNTEGPIVDMLPRDLSCRVRVTMVGHMTKRQAIACKKRYQLNLSLCRKVLSFLYLNHREYQQQVQPDKEGSATTTRVSLAWLSTEQRERVSGGSNVPLRGASNDAPGQSTGVILDNTSVLDEVSVRDGVSETMRDESTYSMFGSTIAEGEDLALEDTWIAASSVLVSTPQPDYVDLVVRKSTDYVPMTKWAVCTRMFPTLFPAGSGGPTEERDKYMSVRRWILRCLRIHGHRFEKHYAFMLLAFDFLAFENARRTLYVRMDVKRQALKAAEVKRSTVLEAIKYFRHMADCKAKGIKPQPPTPSVHEVVELRKGLRVPESAFYGSNIGRMRARHDLFGMLKRFGPMQIFFTISPDSAGTYAISIKSGEIPKAVVDEANTLLAPNRAERKRIAASYPVECARYFLRVVNTVIEVLFGWDRKRNRPKRGGGIFGVVRAFGASAETQLAGDLHAHFAVWLHGFPTTSEKFREALETDAEFHSRFIRLVDTVLSSKPPSLVNEVQCVRCKRDDTIEPVVPGVDAFRRPATGTSPPVTAICRECGEVFRDKDIIDASIQALAQSEDGTMNQQWIDFQKCRPPLDGEIGAVATSILVRDTQVHYWNHCKSCFKKTVRTPKGIVCRFLKPEGVQLTSTCIGTDNRLHLHRPIGCEYVNAFNDVVMTSMKCNHDAQFVLSSGAKDTAAYIVKYCFKRQNPVENQVALSLAAFAKAASKMNCLPADTSPMEKGYKMLGSMLYTLTNGQEVAAPMAALYLLNESPFWFSHPFVRVDLWRLLQKCSESVEISVSQQDIGEDCTGGNIILSDNSLEKYWKRQPDLENVSFIDICERYEPSKKRKRSPQAVRANTLTFVESSSPKVLVICGKEIPDIHDGQDGEFDEYYYFAVLTLFKPHRNSTLLGSAETIISAYRDFLLHGAHRTVQRLQRFESQWQDYYHVERKEEDTTESAEAQILRTRVAATNSWVPDNSNDSRQTNAVDDTIPEDFLDPSTITAPETSTQKLCDDAAAAIGAVANLKSAIRAMSQTYQPLNERVSLGPGFNLDMYTSHFGTSNQEPGSQDIFGTDKFIARFRETRTRLERFRECFEPVPYRYDEAIPCDPDSLPDFPPIASVSAAFRLNFWQHTAFEVSARHLLYAYFQDISDALSEQLPFSSTAKRMAYSLKDQLIGYLGGEAGTGKSTVVDALLTFAQKWGRTGSVETLAFTGVAAINIHGRTIHSARNLKLNGAEPNSAPTIEMKSKFSRVVLVIIDEISITDQGLLGGMDAVSRSMSKTPNKYMGGKHVLFIGDFLQLPPVAGSPCFRPPPREANRQRQAGYALYAAINFVIFLTKNMRARRDPLYAKILDDLRWGRLTDQQLDILNSRVHKPEDLLSARTNDTHNLYKPVVVCTNKLRCAINSNIIFRIALSRTIPVFECLAIPCNRSRLIVEHLWNIDDNFTDRIPMKLLFYVGMPVMVTHKHPDLLGADIIANGTIATIIGTYPPLDEMPEIIYEAGNVVIHKLLRQPSLLLIKLLGVTTTLVEGFPEGVIGLPALKGRVSLKQIPNLARSSITVTQFALVPAFACTTEKLQGQTCHDGVVVTPLDNRQSVPSQTLYVALSRSVSLDGLSLTQSISRSYLGKFVPNQETVNEMQRLMNLVSVPPFASAEERISFDQWKSTQHT